MIEKGPAKKVTIWVNHDSRHGAQKLWFAIFEFLRHKQVAGASVTRTEMSFGDRQVVHRANLVEISEFAYRIEFIETKTRVEEVLPVLYEMVTDGLIEVQDTTVVKDVNQSKPSIQPGMRPQLRKGKAKLMRIFLGERDQWHGEPLYDAIVKRFRMMDIAGATVYRGILGYGAKGEPHRAHFLHVSEDMPIMISVIDSASKIEEAVAVAENMLEDGLIAVSDVDVIRMVHAFQEDLADAGQ